MRELLLVATFALATGKVVQMDRIDSADLTYELLLDYMRRDVPFVIENKHATGDGPNAWPSTKWTTEYITANFHFSEVPAISYGKNTSKWDKKTNFANKFPNINGIRSHMTELQRMRKPLKQFFKNYEKPKRKWGMQMMSANMKCLAPALLNDFPYPWIIAGASRRMAAESNWPSLYIYPKGASLRMHIDTGSKWQYWTQQHVGSKLVRMVTMSDWSKHLLKYFSKGRDGFQRGLDIWKMDLIKNPELAHVTVYESTMHPGDEWYTPIASAHSMIHLNSPTINTVIKWVDRAHEPAVKRLCDEMKSGRFKSSWDDSVAGTTENICIIYEAGLKEPDHTIPTEIDFESAKNKTFWEYFASMDFCHQVQQTCLHPSLDGICHDAFGTSQAGFCVNKGEKYCSEIRRACNRTRQHCYAPIFKQAARDALAKQSSAEPSGEDGACGAESAESGPVSEALKLKEDVQELRSQANRMEAMLSDIVRLLS